MYKTRFRFFKTASTFPGLTDLATKRRVEIGWLLSFVVSVLVRPVMESNSICQTYGVRMPYKLSTYGEKVELGHSCQHPTYFSVMTLLSRLTVLKNVLIKFLSEI